MTEELSAPKVGASEAVARVPTEHVHPSPLNPRKLPEFDPATRELAESIQGVGIIQPLIVRPRAAGGMEIVAGERRYRAALLLELPDLPVIVREIPDAVMVAQMLAENLQRKELNCVEEARGYRSLLDLGMLQKDIALQTGSKPPTISNAIRILKLPSQVLDLATRTGEGHTLSKAHLIALVRYADRPEYVEWLAARVVKEGIASSTLEQSFPLINGFAGAKTWREDAYGSWPDSWCEGCPAFRREGMTRACFRVEGYQEQAGRWSEDRRRREAERVAGVQEQERLHNERLRAMREAQTTQTTPLLRHAAAVLAHPPAFELNVLHPATPAEPQNVEQTEPTTPAEAAPVEQVDPDEVLPTLASLGREGADYIALSTRYGASLPTGCDGTSWSGACSSCPCARRAWNGSRSVPVCTDPARFKELLRLDKLASGPKVVRARNALVWDWVGEKIMREPIPRGFLVLALTKLWKSGRRPDVTAAFKAAGIDWPSLPFKDYTFRSHPAVIRKLHELPPETLLRLIVLSAIANEINEASLYKTDPGDAFRIAAELATKGDSDWNRGHMTDKDLEQMNAAMLQLGLPKIGEPLRMPAFPSYSDFFQRITGRPWNGPLPPTIAHLWGEGQEQAEDDAENEDELDGEEPTIRQPRPFHLATMIGQRVEFKTADAWHAIPPEGNRQHRPRLGTQEAILRGTVYAVSGFFAEPPADNQALAQRTTANVLVRLDQGGTALVPLYGVNAPCPDEERVMEPESLGDRVAAFVDGISEVADTFLKPRPQTGR